MPPGSAHGEGAVPRGGVQEGGEVSQEQHEERRVLLQDVPDPYPIDPGWMERGGFIDDVEIMLALQYVGNQLLAGGKCLSGPQLFEELVRAQDRTLPELPAPPETATPARNYASTVILADVNPGAGAATVMHGSGVLIHPDGLLLTNFHNLEAGERPLMFAVTTEGRVLPVTRIIPASLADDLAILQVDGKDLPFSSPGTANAELLSDVYSIGHPFDRFYVSSKGIVNRYCAGTRHHTGGTGPSDPPPFMQISSSSGLGSSGGPVFDSSGQIVGLTRSQSLGRIADVDVEQRFFHCTPVSAIRKLLENGADEQTRTTLRNRLSNAALWAEVHRLLGGSGLSRDQVQTLVTTLMQDLKTGGGLSPSLRGALRDAGISFEQLESTLNQAVENVSRVETTEGDS